MPSVKEIVEAYLIENDYDGLAGEECGCEIDDLMACCCGDSIIHCEAGYKVPCPEPGGEDGEEYCPAHGDCEWHISSAEDAKERRMKKEDKG